MVNGSCPLHPPLFVQRLDTVHQGQMALTYQLSCEFHNVNYDILLRRVERYRQPKMISVEIVRDVVDIESESIITIEFVEVLNGELTRVAERVGVCYKNCSF